MTAFFRLILRDLRLAFRQRADVVLTLLFFAMTATLFPFAVGPEANLLLRLAPGVVWVTALLAVLLSLERLFLADLEDGSLDLLALGGLPLELVVLAKVVAHWLTTGLPLILATPVIALLFGLPSDDILHLIAAMSLGTPSLSLIGAVGAALTLGARRGGVLIPLLVLPLYIPTLIFGVAASEAVTAEISVRPQLLFLSAIFLVMLLVAPLAGAAALRQALE